MTDQNKNYQSNQQFKASQNSNTLRQLQQNSSKHDYEMAAELDKRQQAYEPTQQYNANKTNQQAVQLQQQQWNARQSHDIEIANELGANYAANVAAMNQAEMTKQQNSYPQQHKQNQQINQNQQDVEFSVDLPNENKSMKGNALPNNNTKNQFNRNKQANYSNVDPETDSNRFEKGNN